MAVVLRRAGHTAMGYLEDHPPIGDDETEDEYLTRLDLWLPGERAEFEALDPDDEAD